MTKEEHTQKIRDFFSGDVLPQHKDGILSGHPILFRSKYNEAWLLNENEIETILHEYQPELSAVVNGAVIVIFHEAKKE